LECDLTRRRDARTGTGRHAKLQVAGSARPDGPKATGVGLECDLTRRSCAGQPCPNPFVMLAVVRKVGPPGKTRSMNVVEGYNWPTSAASTQMHLYVNMRRWAHLSRRARLLNCSYCITRIEMGSHARTVLCMSDSNASRLAIGAHVVDAKEIVRRIRLPCVGDGARHRRDDPLSG
jgi:hypothetical protein